MKLGYFLVTIGMIAIFGGLVNTVFGCLAGTAFFSDPVRAGGSIGTLCLGFVLCGLGIRRWRKQEIKDAAEAEKAPTKSERSPPE